MEILQDGSSLMGELEVVVNALPANATGVLHLTNLTTLRVFGVSPTILQVRIMNFRYYWAIPITSPMFQASLTRLFQVLCLENQHLTQVPANLSQLFA